MACSGGHCTNHGTGTSTCSGHRAACPSNRTLSGSPGGRGQFLKLADIEQLRTRIRAEVNTWNQHAWYNVSLLEGNSRSVGSKVTDNDMFYNLDRMIHEINGNQASHIVPRHASATSTWPLRPGPTSINIWSSWTDPGDQVWNTHYQTLVNEYNAARQNCICNSDCACNNVCACHNDCGCNYSDLRLKKEVVYC